MRKYPFIVFSGLVCGALVGSLLLGNQPGGPGEAQSDMQRKANPGEQRLAAAAAAQKEKPKEAIRRKRMRGHIPPTKAVSLHRHRISTALHRTRLKALPVITAPKWNTVSLGYGPAINDQGSCGDCYINSGCNVCASAQMVSGVTAKGSGFQLSFQYFLDCQNVGGCNGGDEYQVAQIVMNSGAPSAAQYSGPGQSPGTCQSTTGMQLYTVSSLLMCSDTQGVANTQDIKNCVAAYGYVSVAVAANDDWDAYQPGTIMNGPADDDGINHAIGIVGWDDTTSPPSWIVQNSWGTSWGNQGYANVGYGAYSIGTEAFAAIAGPPATTSTVHTRGYVKGSPDFSITISLSANLSGITYDIPLGGSAAVMQQMASDIAVLESLLGNRTPAPKKMDKLPVAPQNK